MNIATEKQIKEYQLLTPLFHTLLKEVKELSKKKPDEIINKFKANTVNKVLSRIKEILKKEPTNDFTEIIDIDSLPSNSDVVLVMVQFETALNKFYTKHTSKDGFNYNRKWNGYEGVVGEDSDEVAF
ncbi:hypothetical protein [Flavobacterium macrobrachii]|uniref:Uncharacterized protein n=1 Tax=Flavobacterium macrobrachii TaxID=591204 RepID=A0ABS2CYZ4_9FLAO|nr:hypothetical protein [Flavobacterium macrobrachii]MBM6500192.1 hypothetical protein [Flavobacterium macrobrachii]